MKIFVFSILFLSATVNAETAKLRVKNGRSYAVDVLRVAQSIDPELGTRDRSSSEFFRGLVANLPQKGQLDELGPSIDTLAKWSSHVCGLYLISWQNRNPDLATQETLVKSLFSAALRRAPSNEERKSLGLDTLLQGPQIFSVCFYVTMNPAFITIRKD